MSGYCAFMSPTYEETIMHLVETTAYAGDTPWHGLGNKWAPQQSIDTWKKRAGMDWEIAAHEVRYISGNNHLGVINAFPQQKVVYRIGYLGAAGRGVHA